MPVEAKEQRPLIRSAPFWRVRETAGRTFPGAAPAEKVPDRLVWPPEDSMEGSD